GLPVDLGERHLGVVGALDRSVLVGEADAGEEGDEARVHAVGIGLLGAVGALAVGGHEVEETVLDERTAEREAGLLAIEAPLFGRRAVGVLRRLREAVVGEEAVALPLIWLVPVLVM